MRGVKKKKKEIVIGSPLSLYELLKKKGKKERKASYLRSVLLPSNFRQFFLASMSSLNISVVSASLVFL